MPKPVARMAPATMLNHRLLLLITVLISLLHRFCHKAYPVILGARLAALRIKLSYGMRLIGFQQLVLWRCYP